MQFEIELDGVKEPGLGMVKVTVYPVAQVIPVPEGSKLTINKEDGYPIVVGVGFSDTERKFSEPCTSRLDDLSDSHHGR